MGYLLGRKTRCKYLAIHLDAYQASKPGETHLLRIANRGSSSTKTTPLTPPCKYRALIILTKSLSKIMDVLLYYVTSPAILEPGRCGPRRHRRREAAFVQASFPRLGPILRCYKRESVWVHTSSAKEIERKYSVESSATVRASQI